MKYKERLEEIEKNLDPLGYGMGGHLISVNDIYWLVKYAKEQAERVQELEQQNKRYREAIERALDESGWGDEGNALHKMISILAKALEDEE